MELAIDTSTRYASVALARQGELLWEECWRSERNHMVELLPAVEHLLGKAQATINALTGVVVARGPGNFSALRVGMSLGKGIALGLGIPIVGVSTLLVEAFPYLGLGMPVYAMLDAGRGQVVWTSFFNGQAPSQTAEEHVDDVVSLGESLAPPAVVCGEGVALHAQDVRAWRKEGLLVANALLPTRRAGVLVHLGATRLMAGDHSDAASLQPVYTRGPSIAAPKGP